MIAIIDYGMGNICSLGNALGRLEAEWTLTSDPEVINSATHVILPGVGNAAEAMHNLRSYASVVGEVSYAVRSETVVEAKHP